MKFFLEREYFTEHWIHTKFVTNTGYGLLVCTMKICLVVILRHRKRGSQIEKHQIDDIFMIFLESLATLCKNCAGWWWFLLQRSRLLSCFKLIAVIDCASKMMMSCARVIMLFCRQICFSVTHFFCIVSSKNNRRVFFLCWFSTTFFHSIHKYWTRNSFYSIFGFDLVDFFCFNRVSNFWKTNSTNHVVLCMSKCRLVYW